MYFNHEKNGKTLSVDLHGEIDHHSVRESRSQIDMLVEREAINTLRLDMSDITFCDSSGLGFIMGRLKRMDEIGGSLVVISPSPMIDKLLVLSGLEKMIKIERKF